MSIASFVPPPLPARPLRVAIVGAGVMGRRHARVIASRPDRFELVAVMDVDGAAAQHVALAHGIRVAAREADALDGAEAVVVATPIAAHASTVKRALSAGIHVLVEKPIAETARVATELLALAESRRARLFVGHSERFNPVVRALARLVDAASVRSIALVRTGSHGKRGGGEHGALVNLGVHDLDIAAYLARAQLTSEQATGDLAVSGVELRADVAARTVSGASVQVTVDQQPRVETRLRTIELATDSHVWLGDLLGASLVRVCRATGAREAVPLDTEEPLLAQALAFASAIRGGPATEIATGLDGERALSAAERAISQLRARGAPVEKLSGSRSHW